MIATFAFSMLFIIMSCIIFIVSNMGDDDDDE